MNCLDYVPAHQTAANVATGDHTALARPALLPQRGRRVALIQIAKPRQ